MKDITDYADIYDGVARFSDVACLADAHSAILNQAKEVERQAYILGALEENELHMIRAYVRYGWAKCIPRAEGYFQSKAEAKAEHKKFIPADEEDIGYSHLTTALTEALQAKVKIIGINKHYDCKQALCAWCVHFKYKKREFYIIVPIIEYITRDNIADTNYGKLAFGYIDKSDIHRRLGESYFLSDFRSYSDETTKAGAKL